MTWGDTEGPMGLHETTGVYGCYLIHILPDASDARGQLLRPYSNLNMEGAPLEEDDVVVRSLPNVFRGMHIQHRSAPQWKYVRVTEGIIVGAVLDTSKTLNAERFTQMTLSAHAPKTGPRRDVGLLIPPWCAWGYYTSFGSEVTYRIWGDRHPEAEISIHGRSFGAWGAGDGRMLDESLMSDRDRNAKPLSEVDTGW